MLPTKLFHYSSKAIKRLRKNYHKEHPNFPYCRVKPLGFWLSVEDDEEDQNWKTWCEAEEFRLEGLKYRYAVVLKKKANILHLTTTQEILDFGLKFQMNNQKDFDAYLIKMGREPYPYVYEIKWEEVMKLWDGIIISPYNWECRMPSETMWYYGWDCASGCIWNLKAIKSYKLDSIREEKEECLEEESGKDSQSEVCCLQG